MYVTNLLIKNGFLLKKYLLYYKINMHEYIVIPDNRLKTKHTHTNIHAHAYIIKHAPNHIHPYVDTYTHTHTHRNRLPLLKFILEPPSALVNSFPDH